MSKWKRGEIAVPKSAYQKLKLLYLARLLFEESDEEHPLSMERMLAYLSEQGINAERKSVYDDIEQLRLFGMDIIGARGGDVGYGYYVGAREFELAELKLLADAVAAAKFISQKKSAALISKLGTLTSRSLSGQLRRQIYFNDRSKTSNENIYYSVDALHGAIAMNRQVSFRYFNYGMTKTPAGTPVRIYRGDTRKISPYALVWDDENYYCLAFDENHPGKVTHYRVDKMENVTLLEEPRLPLPEGIDIKKYGARVFGMYACENIYVRLRATNDLVGVFYDRFGTDIGVCDNGDGTFTTHFETYAGPPLIGWLMQFGARIEVISPDSLRKSVEEQARQITELYSKRG